MRSKSVTTAPTQLAEVQTILQKRFGKQVLFLASDPKFQIRRISTGILTLDFLLGGGIALGRITEFYGQYAALKSHALYRTIALAQAQGRSCALMDAEHSFDPIHAARLGVELDTLTMVGELEVGEEIIDVGEALIRSGKFDLVGVDSIAALVPKDELEESAEASQMGKMGKLTSKMARKWNAVNSGGTAVVLINQVRENVGVHYGNPEKPVGGRAFGFFASQRVDFRKGEAIKGKTRKVENGKVVERDGTIGRVVRIRVEKDKTGANAERDGSFRYLFDLRAVDRLSELLQLGLEVGAVEQSGLKYTTKWSEPMMRTAFLNMLGRDIKVATRLEAAVKVLAHHGD
jgi:recombination protein RecA